MATSDNKEKNYKNQNFTNRKMGKTKDQITQTV